jgi:hypothetical protein
VVGSGNSAEGEDGIRIVHLHLRCDEHLRNLGLEVGCPLDLARRAVDAFTRIMGMYIPRFIRRSRSHALIIFSRCLVVHLFRKTEFVNLATENPARDLAKLCRTGTRSGSYPYSFPRSIGRYWPRGFSLQSYGSGERRRKADSCHLSEGVVGGLVGTLQCRLFGAYFNPFFRSRNMPAILQWPNLQDHDTKTLPRYLQIARFRLSNRSS